MECSAALQTMSSNKSPGSDNLSEEFYVCSFDKIHSYLSQAQNIYFREGQLTSSQRQAVIPLFENRTRTNAFSKTIGQFRFLMLILLMPKYHQRQSLQ